MKKKPKTVTGKYVPMPSAKISVSQARIIGAEIDRLTKTRGCAKPEWIVDDARDENHPMHDMFTWDDSEAAEQWRLEQARSLVRQVRVVFTEQPKREPLVIRAFMSVKASDDEKSFDGRGYVPMYQVLQREDYKKQILNNAMQELREWKKRYEDYRTFFGGVFGEIEKLK